MSLRTGKLRNLSEAEDGAWYLRSTISRRPRAQTRGESRFVIDEVLTAMLEGPPVVNLSR